MLYILYGPDDFSRHEALEEIKKELGNPEMLPANTAILDGQQLSLAQLMHACSAVPFLCPARLVIVEGLLKRFEAKAGAARRKDRSRLESDSGLVEWRNLVDYIKQMPPTTVLALVDNEIKGNNPLLKSLSPLAKVMAFPFL